MIFKFICFFTLEIEEMQIIIYTGNICLLKGQITAKVITNDVGILLFLQVIEEFLSPVPYWGIRVGALI